MDVWGSYGTCIRQNGNMMHLLCQASGRDLHLLSWNNCNKIKEAIKGGWVGIVVPSLVSEDVLDADVDNIKNIDLVHLKGPYADHILIPKGSTGSCTIFDIK